MRSDIRKMADLREKEGSGLPNNTGLYAIYSLLVIRKRYVSNPVYTTWVSDDGRGRFEHITTLTASWLGR